MESKLILGTVQFGLDYGINNSNGKPNEIEIKNILDTAYSNGIHYLDTAESYGDSQKIIGNYHKNSRYKFNIITKYSKSESNLTENLSEKIKKNIKTLNVESLYCYMFHSFSDFEAYYFNFKKEISDLKKDGVINKFGVSLYTNSELKKILNLDDVDLIQIPFNLLDNSTKRKDVLLAAKKKNIEIHTRSVFLQGLFFKPTDELPSKTKGLLKDLNTIKNIVNYNNIEMSDLALNYVISQNYIDKIIIGVDNVNQLMKNINSTNKNLSTHILNDIDNLNVINIELLNPSNWN